ncbi:uncharacterized [Tachysurus ichikawai]
MINRAMENEGPLDGITRSVEHLRRSRQNKWCVAFVPEEENLEPLVQCWLSGIPAGRLALSDRPASGGGLLGI